MKKIIKNILTLLLVTINLGLVLHMDINGVQTNLLAIFLANSLILVNGITKNPIALILGLISCIGLSICPIGEYKIQTFIFSLLLGISFTILAMPRRKKTKKAPKKRAYALKEVA